MPRAASELPGRYEIDVEGPIPDRLAVVFPDFVVITDGDGATLSGPIVDAAQLMAILEYLLSRNVVPTAVRRLD